VARARRRPGPWGIALPPAIGAVLMSLSTVIVAINAQLVRRARL
jgi:Cu2+-exporting ATPase